MIEFRRTIALLVASISLCAADRLETESRRIIKQAVAAAGEDRTTALQLLGTIDDADSRQLLESILRGNDATEIGDVAAGLTPQQCVSYLADLGEATQKLAAPTADRFRILDAIARAGSPQAVQVLGDVADTQGMPAAGVAFGLLERLGSIAEPALANLVSRGRSVWSRETAAATLVRMRARTLPAFRSALHDADEKVRTAGAIGLAELGNDEGVPQLVAAAGNPSSDYQVMALVSLAMLGRSEAFDRLKALITGPDEALRGRTVWTMAWSGDSSLKRFVYRLGLDRQATFRVLLADKLMDPSDPRDRAVLQAMLTTGDEMSQVIAAERLIGTNLSDLAQSVVARALGSQDPAIRSLAIAIASRNPSLEPDLAKRLADPDPSLQLAALAALTDLRRKDRFQEVVPYLMSDNRVVSAVAAKTLAALDPNAASAFLEKGLTSERSYIRIHSAAMLLAIAAHSQTK